MQLLRKNLKNASKAAQETDITTKVVKESVDIFANFIFQSFNNMIVTSIFPAALKLAKNTPAFKKASENYKENYRPVIVFPNVSKIYERLLFNKYRCGFDKCLVDNIAS